jgi:hypothetical protein
MKMYGGLEVSSQLHAPAALAPAKEPPQHPLYGGGEGAVWAPEQSGHCGVERNP